MDMKKDYSELLKMANSSAGKELLNLIQQNQNPQFNEAMKQAEAGDLTAAKKMIGTILDTPEAKQILKRMKGENE